jgi:TolA-binding protein
MQNAKCKMQNAKFEMKNINWKKFFLLIAFLLICQSLLIAQPKKIQEISPEDKKRMEELQKEFDLYSKEAEKYDEEVRKMMDSHLKEREKFISTSYKDRIDKIEIVEKERRNDAIVYFEKFIQKNPNHPKYTADAMFRLAELYYEKTEDDFWEEDKKYTEQLNLYNRG